MNRKKKTLFKSAVVGVTAIATSLTIGMSAACSKSGSSSDNEDDKTTTKIDSQTIKNGNFEFYSDNDGLYLISSPDNWSSGTNGSSSASMSGIIDTGKERWAEITDPDLPQKLEDNNDLESGDENKKDYNGVLTDDLPYKNTHTATDTNSDSTDDSYEEDPKAYIENPLTHRYKYNDAGDIVGDGGQPVETFEDEDGNLFFDSEHTKPVETSVLMIHNYRSGDYHGTETYYDSSTTVSLEANTAAEISVWVKTTEMYFSDARNERSEVVFDRGAYIKVNTQVGGNSLDDFIIRNINTEKLNPDGENNGWVQYTVYVAASSFATTSVSITLGLGENEQGTVEGYAFFDDVSIKKYLNKEDMAEKSADGWANIRETENDEFPNVSYPLSPDAQTEFRVDKESYRTDNENGKVDYDNNFADRHFLIDFSESATVGEDTVLLNASSVTAGLTVEETNTGKYVCTEYNASGNAYNPIGITNKNYAGLYVPNALKTNPINISSDLLATTTISENTFASGDTEYATILNEALKTATGLPGESDSTKALVMLSARGATYEAEINGKNSNGDNIFTLDADKKYMLVSFWLKTSDMDGNTAATVKVVDVDDEDNSSSFSVDSTAQSPVTIGEGENEVEDAYNGWVRCFVRVSNTSNEEKQFKLVVNFGNTSVRDSARSSYRYGWLAMTNPSVMILDEDVYSYTSGSSQSATLSFTETEERTSHRFDTEQGEKNEIKTDLANLASYTGVNGKSLFVNPSDPVKLDGYEDANKNAYAGLLSKDNFANYASRNETNHEDCMWYNALQTIAARNNADVSTSEKLWTAVFGDYSVQPLLIVNTVRTFKNTETNTEESKIYNYGYIGKSQSVNSDSYKAVSVRVKASAGAIANVYLVEDKDGGNVLSYITPEYNFWYDADGNILKGEPDDDATAAEQRENIAYTLRKDGLYENGDGKLYANFYNLTRHYDISDEEQLTTIYNEAGEALMFEGKGFVNGEIYYKDAAKTAYAPHYLIAGGKANNKVYRYSGEGVGANATYYYVEDGKANEKKLVNGVDKSLARYVNTEAPETPYYFEIDTVKNPEYADKWITVTFYIHAGSEAKNYRLELWSGARDEASSYADGALDSYVIFDYSDVNSSLNQSTYDELVKGYTDDIIAEYKKNLIVDQELEDNDANIADLEKLAGDGNRVNLFNYEAAYYTFSLFDSKAFIPFNGETSDEGTGYSFDYSASAESLAYLKIVDDGLPYGTTDKTNATYTMSSFIDYSVLDKDIEILNEPTAPDDSGNDDNNNSGSTNSVNVWLLASSIVLVAAMLIAIAALFIKDLVKKHKRNAKTSTKNSYNFNKNKRYVKKYVKANGEAPEIAEDKVDENLLSDAPATVEEEPADVKVDEQPAVEETPAENSVEESTEEKPAEDSPSESGDEKPDDDGKEE